MSETGGSVARVAPAESVTHRCYRHEALLWSGTAEFVDGTVPFIAEGLAAGQAVMVAVIPERWEHLRAALGSAADDVSYVDMAEVGANPARIIPAWRDFVDARTGNGAPVRGIGEPVWAGRRDVEISECQLHEALLNVALEPGTPLWLRCPYEVEALDPAVIAEAKRSHPLLLGPDGYSGSTSYGGMSYVQDAFGADLPVCAEPADVLDFSLRNLRGVRELVARHARAAGVAGDAPDDLALAAQEVATNSVRYGGGAGRLTVWVDESALVCEIRDRGVIADAMVGRRAPALDQVRGRGLWIANQLCDLVQIRSGDSGTVVQLHTWLQ
jgi:anti-sigma regulatory factor (Ser/Thr protein kinase)